MALCALRNAAMGSDGRAAFGNAYDYTYDIAALNKNRTAKSRPICNLGRGGRI